MKLKYIFIRFNEAISFYMQLNGNLCPSVSYNSSVVMAPVDFMIF